MVSNLFTALALIATGRVEIPPAPAQSIPAPQIRGYVRDEADADKTGRGLKRR